MFSQSKPSLTNDLGFINHLMDIQEYDAALHLLNKYHAKSGKLADTCNYLYGWSYYNKKQMDSASYYLNKVSNKSENFNKSAFFASFCKTTYSDYDSAKIIINKINENNKNIIELKNFQLSAIALLERDLQKFDLHSKQYTYKYYPLVKAEQNMMNYSHEIKEFKPRSMFMAGLLSSIVPGLGKIYIGKYGEGTAAFLMVSIMGIVTYENYKKDGILDPKTLIFGSMFATYYIGNIWGSSIGVKLKRDEFYNEINYKILFDIHIPLRTVFN